MSSEKFIPFAMHVDDHTIKTFAGEFMQVIRLAGYPFETAEMADLNLRKRVRNQILKSFNSSNVAVYYHVVRRRHEALPEGSFPPGFAADLDEAWRAQLAKRQQFENELYLTVIHKRGEGAAKKMQDMFASVNSKADAQERARYEKQARAALEDYARTLMSAFKQYWPERLGVETSADGVLFSEPMRFFGFLLNLTDRPYLIPERPIAEILGVTRPIFRHEIIEMRQPTQTLYAGMLSIKEYDATTSPTVFDKLLSLPFEFVMTQSFRFEERILSEKAIDRQSGRLRSSGDRGLKQIFDLEEAVEESKGEASFGIHHATVMTWDVDAQVVLKKLSLLDTEFAERGIACVREDINLEAAFFAQLPANFGMITRGARISTKNFASFMSAHNYVGGRRQAHWGPAITVLPTSSSTPYYFNLHVADRGNTLVLGPTGQGKTLTLSFLFCQTLKLGGRRVFLDKDRGMEIFVRAVGGKYFQIMGGRPTGWNPLQLEDSAAVRTFLAEWLETLLIDDGGEPINIDDRQLISRVVASNFDLPREYRMLRHVAPMFGNPEQDKLAKRLLEWYDSPKYGEGRFSWMFDNEQNSLDLSNNILGFDMTYILDSKQARTPAMMWLFFVIESLIDGKPMAIFADEGWRLLEDELVVKRLENFEFVIRKNNGLLAFATQTPETVMDSAISAALKQQSETFILFPNPKAEQEVYCQYLGLTPSQFDWIKHKLPERGEPGWFMVKNTLGAAICRLDMTGMEDYISVLSGNKNTVAVMDALIAEHGEDPKVWLPLFLKRWRVAGDSV